LKSKHGALHAASTRIGAVFLVSGIVSLVFSITAESQILAFIGLGLTFWGALFIIITPKRYVEGSLLEATAISSYLTIDRIIKDLKYKGKGYYTPPYPKDVYLPEHLKGLKDMIVFVSAENEADIPSIQELAESKFLLQKPQGVLVTPPGLGLLTQIEKKVNVDFTKISLDELCEVMPRFILDDFSLAEEMEITLEENQVNLKLSDSIYKNLYSAENNLKSISILGCPIASAVACAIAKASGKPVTIQKIDVSVDGATIQVHYRIVQG
jgi:hypothetical protein